MCSKTGMFTVAARDAVYAILRERIHDNLWIVSRRSVDIPGENGSLLLMTRLRSRPIEHSCC